MKTKVLMVYPEIPTTYWSFKHAIPFIGAKSSMPPLGLMTIASLMPDNYELNLIDMNVTELTAENIIKSDLVFISAMIIQKESFTGVVKMCKENNTPVVAGGPYPSVSYKSIENVDYFVLNEAEITLPEFIKDFENGVPKSIYLSDIKPDITKTPPPVFDLIENVNDYTYLALQYSRGCPYNCEFCDIIEMYGRRQRTKEPDQFIYEMELAYNTGFRGSLFIVDDNFIGNKKRTKLLLRKIVEWQRKKNYPFIIFTEASIDVARDDELLDLMVEARFSSIFIGIETPDLNTLKTIKKYQNVKEDVLASIKKIQTHGIEVLGGFIVGFDTDPDNIFDLQIDFIKEAAIPMAMIGLLIALPNTQLYRRLKTEGRLIGDSSGNNTHDLQVNFKPKMPVEKLVEGYKHIISEIYEPKKYFARCMTLLERMPNKRLSNKRVDGKDLRALFLSFFKQSFSSYGFIYLKFLAKIFFTKNNVFPQAVNYAIKGYHLIKITEEIIRAEQFSSMLDKKMRSLHRDVENIIIGGNELITSQLEECLNQLRYTTGKKYRRMNNDTQIYLNKRVKKFNSYCDSIISQWMKKLHLPETGEEKQIIQPVHDDAPRY